jgi:hypothetical protein
MLCTNCGKEVPDTAKVCGYCGHRLKSDVPPVVQPVVIRKRIPSWVWLLGGFIFVGVLIGAIVLIFLYRTNPPSSIPVQIPIAQSTKPVISSPSVIRGTTPTSSLKWKTVISSNDLKKEPFWQVKDPFFYDIGETYNSFKITFQYKWSGKPINCLAESFEIGITTDPSYFLGIWVKQDRTYEIMRYQDDVPEWIVAENTYSESIEPIKGVIQIEGAHNKVTILLGDQILTSFTYDVIDGNSHYIVFNTDSWKCGDAMPTLTDLTLQELP